MLSVHFIAPYESSDTPGGCGGNTLGPPTCSLSNPLAARAMSRMTSASTRIRGPRASRTFCGSRLSSSGDTRDAWRLHDERRHVSGHLRLRLRDLLLLDGEERRGHEEVLAEAGDLLGRAVLLRRDEDLLDVGGHAGRFAGFVVARY